MDIGDFVMKGIREFLLPALFTLSLAVFVWGALKYRVQGIYDEEAREMGKAVMLYALIVFVIMSAIWLGVRIIVG